MKTDILMVGVGGQGTVLASDILCDVALSAGYDVKKSEIHGMAQRGGSVISHVRIGKKVFSPVIPVGSADILVSFEKMEFLRYFEYINNETILLLNEGKIYPPGAAGGEEKYPDSLIEEKITIFKKYYLLNAFDIADKVFNRKVTSTVMLGKLASVLEIKPDIWKDVISEKVPPKTKGKNIEAFDAGYNT
jgi:indolepyruvate ferredoxin oxidoreductase beta subunit